MNIDLKLSPETIIILNEALQPIYNTKSSNRREKCALSIALDVVVKIESKAKSLKSKMNLFDAKKKVKISLKPHEADVLEIILIQQIKDCNVVYIKHQIQKIIDMLNQKLA